MTNEIKNLENKFVNAMGNGVAAALHLSELIRACVETFDTRNISSVVNRLDKKKDVQGSRAVRTIFKSIFTGATFANSKDGATIVLKLKDKSVDQEALSRLMDGVQAGLSIRDALVKRVKGTTDEVKAVSGEDYAKAIVRSTKKKVEDGAMSSLDALNALRAAIKVLEAEAVAAVVDTRTLDRAA